MQKIIKYTYGYYKDDDIFVIECLNNFNLYGQSETKKDIVKNTVDFTVGILDSLKDLNIPFPVNTELIRNKSKYEKVFNLYFDAKTGKHIKKQSEKV